VKAGTLKTSDGGTTYTFDVTPTGDGAVTVQVPADKAINTKGNGNTPSNELKVTYDGTAPKVTVNKQTTSDTTPKITGTVDDKDATVKVTVNGKTYEATVSQTPNEDGTYNWEVPDGSIQEEDALTPGQTYDVDAVATDKVGNAGTDTTDKELTITGDNTPPIITTATPLTITQGSTLPLSNTNLKATDNEDNDPTLTYTLTTTPEKGKLYITPAGGTKTELTPNGRNTFTQDDIDNGRITYEHTADDTLDDSFKVKVTDSKGAQSAEATVIINVNPKPESPDLSEDKVKSPGLIEEKTQIPGQSYRLTEEPTKGTFYRIEEDDTEVPPDNDLSEGEVTEPELIEGKVPGGQTYKLVEEPTRGTVYLVEDDNQEPVELTEGDTFTDEDIEEGNLLYEPIEEGSSSTDLDEGGVAQENLDENNPVTGDSFVYTIIDPQGGESEELPFVITFNPVLGLEMDLVCDTIAIAGGLMNCTVVYTNTGTITTTALWVGVTQPLNTIFAPDTSDPRWQAAIGDRTMSSIDRQNSTMLTYDYAALVENLGPKQSGVIKVVFRVSEDMNLDEPVGLNVGFQDRVGEEVVVEAQDSASVSVAKAAIYLPIVVKATN
jgi:hypothetical protein